MVVVGYGVDMLVPSLRCLCRSCAAAPRLNWFSHLTAGSRQRLTQMSPLRGWFNPRCDGLFHRAARIAATTQSYPALRCGTCWAELSRPAGGTGAGMPTQRREGRHFRWLEMNSRSFDSGGAESAPPALRMTPTKKGARDRARMTNQDERDECHKRRMRSRHFRCGVAEVDPHSPQELAVIVGE
jgi:hypothetical protein